MAARNMKPPADPNAKAEDYARPRSVFGAANPKPASMPSKNKGVPKGTGGGVRQPGPNVVKNNPFAGNGMYRNYRNK